ncbi:H0102C09.1 protein [Haematococcus lacustris]|uniref:H0102C09.1 protein n=1 Tax=Haematococcus lacustris TaxID=44745 RepID=A0A699YX91_HAELA|nr:H0102C09.1 protein [Haematococcus lacustris]
MLIKGGVGVRPGAGEGFKLLHDYRPLHEPHHIIVANGGRIEAQGQGVVKPVPVAGGFSLAARTCSDPLVLHHRLGHPGYRQLARLLREGMAQTVAGEAATATAAVGDKRAVGVDTLLLQIVQRRHFERVRNCVEFPDFVTLCYSARYGSNNGSGSERDGRWVLKVKRGSDGSIVKYKARWVVKGFRQRDGVDYFEDVVFAPVVMHPRAWYLCLREQLEQIGF